MTSFFKECIEAIILFIIEQLIFRYKAKKTEYYVRFFLC